MTQCGDRRLLALIIYHGAIQTPPPTDPNAAPAHRPAPRPALGRCRPPHRRRRRLRPPVRPPVSLPVALTTRSSAAQVGYLQDPFASLLYRPPMPQPGAFAPQAVGRARKPPLINVGTHHRTWGIDRLVDRFLQRGGKQVVSLGAGSDTRFWRLMVRPSCPAKTSVHTVSQSRATPPDLARYVEIDFPHLTSPKAQRIARHRKLYQYLGPSSTAMPPPGHPYTVSKGGTQLSSPLYTLLPLDLRPSPSEPASSISAILSHHVLPQLDPRLPTLFLAECLFPYMSPEDSREIIKWFGETFCSCMGVVYEMVGLDDSFGNVMKRNLAVSRSFFILSLSQPPNVLPRCATCPSRGPYSQRRNRKLAGSLRPCCRAASLIAQVRKPYGRLERKTSVPRNSSGRSCRLDTHCH